MEACERRSNVSLASTDLISPSVCAMGYIGVLCGACTTGYQLESDGRCSTCRSTSWVGAAALSGALVVGVFVATQIHKWFNSWTCLEGLLELIKELQLKAFAKVLVVTAQIVSSFAPVLNIQMPHIFQSFLRILSVFNFDITIMIGVGCFSDGSYVTSLATSFGLVIAVVALVGLDYLYEMRKLRSETDMPGPFRIMFDRFDTDGNGTIELAEMIRLVQAIDETATLEQATALFRQVDTDGNGALDFDEFLAAVKLPSTHTGLDLRALLNRQRKADVDGNAVGRLFLLVFLLYIPALALPPLGTIHKT
jgi:hypothetical protein